MIHIKHENHVGPLVPSTTIPVSSMGIGTTSSSHVASLAPTPSPQPRMNHNGELRQELPERKSRIRARAKNWTETEKVTLLNLVLKLMPHRCPKTYLWEQVAKDLQEHAGSHHLRSVEQCKQQLRDLKKGYMAAAAKRSGHAPVPFKFRDQMEALYRKEEEHDALDADLKDGDPAGIGRGRSKRRGPRMRIPLSPSKRRRSSAPPGFYNSMASPGPSHTVMSSPIAIHNNLDGPCTPTSGVPPSGALPPTPPSIHHAGMTFAAQNSIAPARASTHDGIGSSIQRNGPTMEPSVEMQMDGVASSVANGLNRNRDGSPSLREISKSVAKVPELLQALTDCLRQQAEFQAALLKQLNAQTNQNAELMRIIMSFRKDPPNGN